MEWDHCRINEPEIFNQAVGPIGIFNNNYRELKGKDVEQNLFCRRLEMMIGLSLLRLWNDSED